MACRRRATVALAGAVLALVAPDATAQGVRNPIPLAARARLDLHVATSAGSAPWSWDAQTRSPLAGSRFMADLTAGESGPGTLYLKGAANWRDADDAAGRVAFTLDQGEYFLRRTYASGAVATRVFGDERRYFTGELGTLLLDDDTVERFEHRFGAALAATYRDAGADYLASALDDGRGTAWLQRAAVRVSSRHAHVGLAYQHTAPEQGEDRALAQAEAAGHYRGVTAIASFAQSGLGSGFFYPSGSFDDGAAGYADVSPDNAATFFEARARALRLDDALIDAIYRYDLAGAGYVNPLAATRAGREIHDMGLYVSHRRLALDGRLVWRDERRFALEDARRRGLEATARAFLRDNSQLLVRGAFERRALDGGAASEAGFVQGGYRRDLQRFMGGVHLMLDDIGEGATPLGAVEARVNWNATSAFYARWIVSDGGTRDDAIFARLEFRPTGRTWVTFAWGWAGVGDAPYVFDDRDGLPSNETRDVLTLTVRGDF